MSQASDSFVAGLKASIESWRMPQETESLYRAKLVKWRLPAAQWGSALDRIIESNTEGKLPSLAAIYSELERQQDISEVPPDLGWASFRLDGKDFAIRIKAKGGNWLIADLVWKDSHGVEHHKQQHVGEPVVNHIPACATDLVISPDNPARPEPQDLPKKSEVDELVKHTNLAILKGAASKSLRLPEGLF